MATEVKTGKGHASYRLLTALLYPECKTNLHKLVTGKTEKWEKI